MAVVLPLLARPRGLRAGGAAAVLRNGAVVAPKRPSDAHSASQRGPHENEKINDAIFQIEDRLDRLERRVSRIAWFVAAHILISTVIAGILVFGTQ